MRLKLPTNSFLIVRERKRGNVCINSKCISFADVCDVELSKMLDDCETLVLALSLPVGESNFGLSATCFVLTLICLFCRYIFPPCFNVANNIVFLN